MFRLIVDPSQEDVFKSQFATGYLKVEIGCLEDRIDSDFLIDGDESAAEFIVRGVERDGQMESAVPLGQFSDGRGESDGRDGDSPGTDSESLGATGPGQGIQDRIEVGQGFAHSHHHDVAQSFFGRESSLQQKHLLEDFAGRQVSHDPVQAAGAEDTTHGTTDLAADADRATNPVP